MNYQRMDSSDQRVYKYIFDFGDAVVESVLYRYPDFQTRTVLCISVQSGCPVGCKFCGTGKHFVRNLTSDEIVSQVKTTFKDQNIENINENCEKLQIMFMSMGEPMLNWDNVEQSIRVLNKDYPNADLLISTVGIKDLEVFKSILKISYEIDKIGLQFSLHKINEQKRNKLIPYDNKLSILEIREFGSAWAILTGRNPYLNICIEEDEPLAYYASKKDLEHFYENMSFYIEGKDEMEEIIKLFPGAIFNLTFSVICNPDSTMKDSYNNNIEIIKNVSDLFFSYGYNTRVFDPAGQDDIGGGCGQLWHFQKWFNKKNWKEVPDLSGEMKEF